MGTFRYRLGRAALAAAMIGLCGAPSLALAQTSSTRIDDALQNITSLVRSGQVGYATFWDGNKFTQCRRWPDRTMRCEAAGASMQPSLKSALTGERLARLATLGWVLDPSFGNYVQTFPADMATARIADHVLRTLTEAYGAEAAALEISTKWIADVTCPPRAGFSQNLAGSVNDAPSMQSTAVHACSYKPDTKTPQTAYSAAELITIYGVRTTAEIQRLRINAAREVFAIFDAGIGYVQCMPETPPPTLYCEAQSAESWPALAAIVTPERVARLHSAGYSDPARAPNYWKLYSFDKITDAAIASEILTIMHEVYGYTGAQELKISTK
jgi:hypothetical protein